MNYKEDEGDRAKQKAFGVAYRNTRNNELLPLYESSKAHGHKAIIAGFVAIGAMITTFEMIPGSLPHTLLVSALFFSEEMRQFYLMVRDDLRSQRANQDLKDLITTFVGEEIPMKE